MRKENPRPFIQDPDLFVISLIPQNKNMMEGVMGEKK